MEAKTEDKSSVWRKVVSCAVGATAAGFAAPVICAAGAGMAVTCLGAAVVSAAVSNTVSNAMRPSTELVHYHPHAAQEFFRDAVSRFLQSHLDPVIDAIRRSQPADFGPQSFTVRTGETLRILPFAYGNNTSIFLELKFRVRPRPGTPERKIEESQPPPELPEYVDPDATEAYNLPEDLRNAAQSVFDGLGTALFRGVAVGTAGVFALPVAPAWYFLETAPGVAGIVYGMPTVTGTLTSAAELGFDTTDQVARIGYAVHFVSEIKLRVNRVVQCAIRNGVELEYNVKTGIGKAHNLGSYQGGRASQGNDWLQIWYEDSGHIYP